MYMCRETIRKAVVQKFNETNDWYCKNWEDLYERIEFNTIEGRKEANAYKKRYSTKSKPLLRAVYLEWISIPTL